MLRFLIADDNAAYCAVLCQMIESRPDWSVVAEANDGAQAVRLAAQFAPDVVLIDVNMPVMNGIVAIQRIKHVVPWARAIAFSGYDDEEFHEASLRAGADCYLRKEDLDLENLSRLIATFFSSCEV